ncbi:hypothetical protein OIU78_030281 [Salix suchowensis]|nr:hypothetical protein OIU78_030281 [Salix suchowensis]
MWRRVTSLSPVISTSKPNSLDQAAFGFKIWRSSFSTETPTLVKDGPTSFQREKPIYYFCPRWSCLTVNSGPRCLTQLKKAGLFLQK